MEIIHFVEDGYYICNRDMKPSPHKSTDDPKKVTCLNCRYRLDHFEK